MALAFDAVGRVAEHLLDGRAQSSGVHCLGVSLIPTPASMTRRALSGLSQLSEQ